jgi:hypothetical protein
MANRALSQIQRRKKKKRRRRRRRVWQMTTAEPAPPYINLPQAIDLARSLLLPMTCYSCSSNSALHL